MKRLLILLLPVVLWAQGPHNVALNNRAQYFDFQITASSTTITIRGLGQINVAWGDGSSTAYSLSNSDRTLAHTYSSNQTWRIKIYRPQNITYWSSTDNVGYAFHWSETFKMRLIYFICSGSNTLTGTLSLPSGMTYFGCWGSNTLTGTLSLPSGMTYFVCTGSNTLSGTLSLASGMTTFSCTGSNTLTGTLSLPSSITYFSCIGSNTLSGYSTQSFSNSMNYFYLLTSNGAGFSAAQVDQLCIDLDGSAWAGSNKTLNLTGSVVAAPTEASAAARASLVAKGVAVTTN